MDKREKRARQMAEKDGQNYNALDEILVNAYLHNADTAIATEEVQEPVENAAPGSLYVCPRCKDKGWMDDKPCLECNSQGLTDPLNPGKGKGQPEGDEVVDEVADEVIEEDTKVNLCDTCSFVLPTCDSSGVLFAEGTDIIVKCPTYQERETEPPNASPAAASEAVSLASWSPKSACAAPLLRTIAPPTKKTSKRCRTFASFASVDIRQHMAPSGTAAQPFAYEQPSIQCTYSSSRIQGSS